jgi:hypothetical protein
VSGDNRSIRGIVSIIGIDGGFMVLALGQIIRSQMFIALMSRIRDIMSHEYSHLPLLFVAIERHDMALSPDNPNDLLLCL